MAATVVPGRMFSSVVNMSIPFGSFTAILEVNRPWASASAARRCDSAANSSVACLEYPYFEAIRSAEIPCGTKFPGMARVGSINIPPPSEPIATRDMLSTPPAIIKSRKPDLI